MSENTFKLYTRMPSDFTLGNCVTALTFALLYDLGRGGKLFLHPQEVEKGANVCISISVETYDSPAHEHLKDAG